MDENPIRHLLKRFGIEWTCLLLLLHGSPLQAVAEQRSTLSSEPVSNSATQEAGLLSEGLSEIREWSDEAEGGWSQVGEQVKGLATVTEEPMRIAQLGGSMPLPARFMAALFGASPAGAQTSPPGPGRLKAAVSGCHPLRSPLGQVHEELNLTLGLRDRGVKHTPFHVLMGAKMPAVLVELVEEARRSSERDAKVSEQARGPRRSVSGRTRRLH